jgi:hypothetical protein
MQATNFDCTLIGYKFLLSSSCCHTEYISYRKSIWTCYRKGLGRLKLFVARTKKRMFFVFPWHRITKEQRIMHSQVSLTFGEIHEARDTSKFEHPSSSLSMCVCFVFCVYRFHFSLFFLFTQQSHNFLNRTNHS